jgi:uncharacterized protein YuzE
MDWFTVRTFGVYLAVCGLGVLVGGCHGSIPAMLGVSVALLCSVAAVRCVDGIRGRFSARITFDPDADASVIAFVKYRRGIVAWTYECDSTACGGMVNLDFDDSGKLIGIEVVGATNTLPPEVLARATKPDPRE